MYLFSDTLNAPLSPHIPSAINYTVSYQTRHRECVRIMNFLDVCKSRHLP